MKTYKRLMRVLIFFSFLLLFVSHQASAEDVYSLFGKLFLSGRIEYDFTDTRDFLVDKEDQDIRQDKFDFDRLFRRGFYSVLIIEETAGNIKNILSLGDVPTQFTSYTFNRSDLTGVRWDVRSEKTDVTFLMVPGNLNPLIIKEVPASGIGLRQVSKYGKSKIGASWFFRDVPIIGVDAETNFSNYGLKAEFALSPRSSLTNSFQDRFDNASAAVIKAFRTVGNSLLRGEIFRIGKRFDSSMSVSDNDDQDRYTDNTLIDQPSKIIPGDLDKNDNGVFDYEDDILLFDVDEDFLDQRDVNNNGIRDQEENDKDPDYEFDLGLKGFNGFLEYRQKGRGKETSLNAQLQNIRQMRSDDTSIRIFGNLNHKRDIPNFGSIYIEDELKYAKDHIPDDTWYFAGFLTKEEEEVFRADERVKELERGSLISFFPVRGGAEVEKRRPDPLLMQNDLIDTLNFTFEYIGLKKMVSTLRFKLQYDSDLNEDDKHYEVGIFKSSYSFRPSKSIEIIPQYKFRLRNGFKVAETKRVDEVFSMIQEDGNKKDKTIRLLSVSDTEVLDQTQAYILKVVYQFTKTIKITGGLQLLFFNDHKDNSADFVRQALLGELEKNFTAYEKELFLHIGARYIDQRAKGIANDQNFMQTFVRVFTKF